MKTRLATMFAVLSSTFLAACGDGALFIANLPARFSDVSVTRDIAYSAADPARTLDIYTPGAAAAGPLPVIVFLYGGRWTFGRKAQYAFVATRLAQQGFIVAVPDYRKYPSVKFPAFVEDGAEAVAWLHDNAAAHGGDPERLFLAGHSAGAHIGALIAADPSYLRKFGKSRSVVTAFAGLAGPYAFTPDEDDLKDMFGPPERYPLMQATGFIDGKQPPMLLLYGAKDDVVRPYNLERLSAAIKARGGTVETKIYPDVNHTQIVGAFSVFLRHKAPVTLDLTRFFQAQTRGERS
jgi:acetyl esterase/lipase